MIPVRHTLLAALALSAALPAVANAATWSQAPGPCYVSVGPADDQRETVSIAATGFTPGAPVDVLVDGAVATSVSAGLDGLAGASLAAPYQQKGERQFAIALTQRSDPSNTVSATTRVTALQVEVKPAKAQPSQRVRFRGAGFISAAPVWAHYVYRGALRRTMRIAHRPTGVCGHFSVRRRQIPITRPRTGVWTVQFDQQKAYAPQPDSVFVRLAINVRRVIPPG
jgi:hypothetical protein